MSRLNRFAALFQETLIGFLCLSPQISWNSEFEFGERGLNLPSQIFRVDCNVGLAE